MFLALPYYSHSFAKTVHSCFLYTTRGDAEDIEFQESVYRNDWQGCYIAYMRPNTFTGILPSSDNLDSNNETELTDLANDAFLSLFV